MKETGFTLIELLVSVAIVAILSSIALPQYQNYKLRAKISAVVQEFKLFEKAFIAYELENDSYPPDRSPGIFPAQMAGLLSSSHFTKDTPIGGKYDWEGPSDWDIAGISVRNSTYLTSASDWRLFDQIIDNGNTNTGKFRFIDNGYIYVIDEDPN